MSNRFKVVTLDAVEGLLSLDRSSRCRIFLEKQMLVKLEVKLTEYREVAITNCFRIDQVS